MIAKQNAPVRAADPAFRAADVPGNPLLEMTLRPRPA
jgi:hypothetical protein